MMVMWRENMITVISAITRDITIEMRNEDGEKLPLKLFAFEPLSE